VKTLRKTLRKRLQSCRSKATVRPASAGNSLKIGAGNDVVIKAGSVSAGGSASITAGNDLLLIAQDKGRQVSGNFGKRDKDGKLIDPNDKSNSFSYGTYDQTGVNINIGGNLNLSAGRDFFAQGTQVNAGGGVNISAGRDASVTTALKGSSYDYNRVTTTRNGIFGKQTRTITTRETDLTNTASNINAGGGADITAGRDLTLQGTNINAAGINLSAGNNVNVLAAYDIKEKTDINSLKSNFKGGSTTNIELDKKAKVSNLNGNNGAVNITAGNTITLEGTLVTGASFTPTAQKTNLLAAMDTKTSEHTKTSNNLVWQSTQSKGTTNQVMHLTNINVPVGMSNFQGAGGITVQLPKNASLTEQITSLAKQPGNEYLTDLSKRSDIDWQRVEVINKSWDYKKEGLTPAAKIVVGIAISILMPANLGSGLLNGLLEGSNLVLTSTGAAMANAAVATLATQTAIAVIDNKGDLGAALKDLGSKDNIKALVTAIATAGLLDKLGTELNLKSGKDASFIDKLQTNLINGVASSVLSTAINGGSIEDALKNAIKGAVINTLAAQGANTIGDAQLDIFTSNLAHAILGCAVGSATTGNSSGCAAGAGGAVVGHVSAELYGTTFGGTDLEIANFAKLTTALTGLVTGQDASKLNIALNTSNNAVVNNYLSRPELRERDKALKACQAKNDPVCEVNVLKEYEKKSAKNTADITYKSVLEKDSLLEIKAGLIASLNDPTLSAETKEQTKKSIKEIDVALNVIEKSPIIKNAAEVGLLAADILFLGELTVAKTLTTKAVQELVLKRTGTEISELEAAKISNNFYADGANPAYWTIGKPGESSLNLAGHWEKHRAEFPSFSSANDYYRAATDFVTLPPPGTLTKVTTNGDVLLYNPTTNTFGVRTIDGAPRTMFRPDPSSHGFPSNIDFWNAK
jgi:filamentous hemagglutinin